MYQIQECPCCHSREAKPYPALVSPFIASYVLKSVPTSASLLECRACSFRYFSERFDGDEISRLYQGYRDQHYFQERHRSEFWYTQEVNDGLGKDPAEITLRTSRARNFMQKHLQAVGVKSADAATKAVLDFGGDRGQFIPDEIWPEPVRQEKFVYEISGVEPVPGVSVIATEKELMTGKKFDLVMICHVLEHCPEPDSVLQQARLLAKDSESLFYIELPFERYSLGLVPRGFLYRSYLKFIARLPFLLTFVDLYSTAIRLKFNFVPPLGFLKLHEHINFFEESSLLALLTRNGFTVLDHQVVHQRKLKGIGSALLCLAKATAP